MKRLLLLIFSFAVSGVYGLTYTEDFDVAGNWGGGAAGTYNSKTYVSAGDIATFSGDLCIRENSGTLQNGFPRTHSGDYSWRLRNAAGSNWEAKIETGGVSTFSVWVRRWDAGPGVDYNCEFSTDNGSTWTTVVNITNAWLGNSSDWSQINGIINTSNGAGAADDIIIRISRTTGERLMIDDFEVTDFVAGPTITTSQTAVTDLDYVEGDPNGSNEGSFTVDATGFAPNSVITLTAPTNFLITATSGSGYVSSLTFTTDASGNMPAPLPNVYVILQAGLSAGNYGLSDLDVSGPSATTVSVSLSGTVTANVVNFSVATDSAPETAGTYTITVTSLVAGSHTVDVVATAAGTAIDPTNYSFTTQTLSFSGVTSQTISVTINDNITCDGNVNVVFELQNAISCTIGATDELDLLITDNEQSIIPIDFQGFEGAGWLAVPNPAAYDMSNDTWDIQSSLGSISPATGTAFWGMEDLNNGNGGGNFDHTLTFEKDISLFSDVEIEFKWSSANYNSTDQLNYELVYDGVAQGNVSICVGGGCTSPWTTITNAIPNTVSIVRLILKARQDGGGQYAGFDDILISGLSCSTCFEPTAASVFSGSSPTSVGTTSATLSWNIGGNGDNSLVVIREGSTVGSQPFDGTSYNANSVFGTGDVTGSNDYSVYNGNGNSVNVTGFNPGSEYFAEIFEYNCLPGNEDYLTSVSGTDIFVTRPEPAENLTELCVTDNSIELMWDAPLTGSFDGYLLVARAVANPSGVAALDPSSQTFNQDFTLAPTYGSASSVVYNGSMNSVTITGLTEGTTYNFRLYSYAIGAVSSEYQYTSSFRSTTENINQMDVLTCGGFAGDTEATLSWSLPFTGCWDEIMVTVDGIGGINQSPTGNGSAYTASPVYGAGTVLGPTVGYVVYKGSGTDVTVTGLSNSTAYSFEIFVRNGTDWSLGKEVILVPNNATILEPGDLAIVAVNTAYLSSGGDDEICFVAFEDINESTSIDFTDNGYERINSGLWAGTEGTIRLQRTGGGTIPSGQTICFQGEGNDPADFDIYLCGVLDNANWTVVNLNGATQFYNLNQTDQIWIMQGGTWTGGNGAHNGFYSGNVLYGWTAIGWEPNPNYNNTSGSTLFPGAKCFTTDLNGVASEDKVKYTGPTTSTSKLNWISRINNVSNWTGYATNAAYSSGGPDYVGSCVLFGLTTGTFSEGVWTGAEDDQWFECGNWSNLKVPDGTIDVDVSSAASNDAIIDATHPDAAIYGSIAEVNNLDITGSLEILGAADVLQVNAELLIWDSAILLNQNGGNIEIFGSLELLGNNAALDMNSAVATPSTLTLHGDWINGALGGATNGFIEGNSEVIFVGTGTQELEISSLTSGMETFHNLTVNKSTQTKIEISGGDLEVSNVLAFGSGGFIDSYSDDVKVIVSNTSTTAITGYEAPNATGTYPVNDGFIQGRLERSVLSGNYDFPVGDRPAGIGYNPVNMNISAGTGNVSAIFDPAYTGVMYLYDNTQMCAGVQRILNYDEFANDGFWNLTGPSGMNYTVTMHPNLSTNPPLAPPPNNEYRLMRAPSGSAGGTWPNASAYEGDICVTTDYYAATSTYTGFSDFAIQGDILDPAQPIELLSFDAKAQDRDIMISWVTATEIQNNLFKVYHSVDGINWDEINTQSGAGDSQEELHYSFLHKNPSFGLHYYQLKQIDFDGASTTSEIEVAEIGSSDDIVVYPIPASEYLVIDSSFEIDALSIQVYSDRGRLISGWNLNNNRLNIQKLSSGVYFIKFIGLQNAIVKKFVKVSTE